MLSKQGLITFVVMCDECGDESDTDEEDFLCAVQAVKDQGWVIRPDERGGWLHVCPNCHWKDLGL